MVKKTLVASAEILCAKLTESVTDTDGFMANPKSYIFSLTNVDIGSDLEVQVVENSDSTINLALPYYSQTANASTPASVGEGDMASVAGGVIDASTPNLTDHERAVVASHGSFANKDAMHDALIQAYPDRYNSK